jgi:hypothetical protein
VLITVSIRETDMPDKTVAEAKELLSILHLQMRFVAYTEDIPAGELLQQPQGSKCKQDTL